MARGDRVCIICGKKYHYCGSNCQEPNAKETWRALYCSQACRTAFDVFSKFVNGHMSADVAYEKLSALDVDKMLLNEQLKENWEQIKKQRTVQPKKENPVANQQTYNSKKIEPFKKKN